MPEHRRRGTNRTERDFHQALHRALGLGWGFGHNLDALWDILTGMAERPLTLIWRHSAVSEQALGAQFHAIVNVLREAMERDAQKAQEDRFTFELQ